MSVKVKLFASYLLIIVLTAVVDAVSWYNLDKVNDQSTAIAGDALPGIVLADKMNTLESDFRKYTYAHIVAVNPADMNSYEQSMKEIEKEFDDGIQTLKKRGAGTSQEANVNRLAELWGQYKTETEAILALSHENKKAEANAMVLGANRDKDREMTKILGELVAYNTNRSVTMSAEADDSYNSAVNVIMGLLLLALVLSIAVATYIVRYISGFITEFLRVSTLVSNADLREKINFTGNDEFAAMTESFNTTISGLAQLLRRIQSSAEQVAASSEELTASSEQTALVTTQVAQSITTVSTETEKSMQAVNSTTVAVEEISASVEEVAANAKLSADSAMEVISMAKEGGMSIDKAIQQMNNIEKTVNESAQVVDTLGERSKEIDQIVETISGIAGQTNLLALNAAIEAARAGEHGKGFAVVAEEVRKLAEQSQEAAQQISELIGRIQNETQQAVSAMQAGTEEVKTGTVVVNESGEAFRRISELISSVSDQADNIAHTINEVALGTQDIVGHVRDIDQGSRSVASETQNVSAAAEEQSASMEEIAASSQALARLAQELQGEVGKFRL